jgi:hypothetical protein
MKSGKRRILWLVMLSCLVLGGLLVAAPAKAADHDPFNLDFEGCNFDSDALANLAVKPYVDQMQATVRTYAGDPTKLEVVITNLGPLASFIRSVYFKGISLLGSSTPTFHTYSGTVNMGWNVGAPADLPGGNVCGFEAEARMTANTPQPQNNGINGGESLGVVFSPPHATVDEIFAACEAGTFAIGLHLQGFTAIVGNTSELYGTNGTVGSISMVNVKCDDGGGTFIDLASSSVEEVDGGVQVNWTTAVEIDNAGFNLYRASSSEGSYVESQQCYDWRQWQWRRCFVLGYRLRWKCHGLL